MLTTQRFGIHFLPTIIQHLTKRPPRKLLSLHRVTQKHACHGAPHMRELRREFQKRVTRLSWGIFMAATKDSDSDNGSCDNSALPAWANGKGCQANLDDAVSFCPKMSRELRTSHNPNSYAGSTWLLCPMESRVIIILRRGGPFFVSLMVEEYGVRVL